MPLVLIGNKCDLDYDRQISTEEGRSLASSWEVPFFETSAKTRTNIEDSIFELVRSIPRTGIDYKLVIVGTYTFHNTNILKFQDLEELEKAVS